MKQSAPTLHNCDVNFVNNACEPNPGGTILTLYINTIAELRDPESEKGNMDQSAGTKTSKNEERRRASPGQWRFSICSVQSSAPSHFPHSLPPPPTPHSPPPPLPLTRRLFLRFPLPRHRLSRTSPPRPPLLPLRPHRPRQRPHALPNHLSADEARRIAGTSGPTLLLTIPESVGYEQNPLSLYYCYDDLILKNCIAEVTNTPWGERVLFVFDPDSDLVAKPLHVSPFMGLSFGKRKKNVLPGNRTLGGNLRRMRIVGLTGGISSGKSTVSNLFKAHDIPVVDADLVARGTGGWKKVVSAFGQDILQPDGEVDRPKLGQIVFSNPEKRQLLNRLLAPYISSGIFWEISKIWLKGFKVIVLDVSLLFEAKMDRWTKPIIVVWVDPETQVRMML
ncbi:hypothetical protein ACLB2K_033011 [Fragaria x ananassa]